MPQARTVIARARIEVPAAEERTFVRREWVTEAGALMSQMELLRPDRARVYLGAERDLGGFDLREIGHWAMMKRRLGWIVSFAEEDHHADRR
jgi:hypothetical protein